MNAKEFLKAFANALSKADSDPINIFIRDNDEMEYSNFGVFPVLSVAEDAGDIYIIRDNRSKG